MEILVAILLQLEIYMKKKLLIDYINCEDFQLVVKLLDSGESPEEKFNDWSALHWATQSGNVLIVKELLKRGADVNIADESGISPLALAVGENNLEMAKLLILNGADANKKIAAYEGGEVIHLACSFGYDEMIELLVNFGNANLLSQDDLGRTAKDFLTKGVELQ